MTEESHGDRWQPRLHILKLHESPVQGDNYERFSLQWVLEDQDGTALPRQENGDSDADFRGIEAGDLVFFPELLTGAGEFEGMRFAGTRQPSEEGGGGIPLWPAGIEYPEFPQAIITLAEEKHTNLRSAYGDLIDTMLNKSPASLRLEDVFGGAAEVEEYWTEPAVIRRLRAVEGEWRIPLNECTCL